MSTGPSVSKKLQGGGCLINLKDVEAASVELGKFRLTTWNEKMVAVSQEKLDNLIVESA